MWIEASIVVQLSSSLPLHVRRFGLFRIKEFITMHTTHFYGRKSNSSDGQASLSTVDEKLLSKRLCLSFLLLLRVTGASVQGIL